MIYESLCSANFCKSYNLLQIIQVKKGKKPPKNTYVMRPATKIYMPLLFSH